MNATPSKGTGSGEPCMICLEPVPKGSSCVRIAIAKAKIGWVTKSHEEEAHPECAEKFASALRAVIEELARGAH